MTDSVSCCEKHTKYQPADSEWKCPECGIAPPEGICIDEGPNMMCEKLHDEDTLVCYNKACGYVTSGKRFAAGVMKRNNVIECPHCKGKGVIKK